MLRGNRKAAARRAERIEDASSQGHEEDSGNTESQQILAYAKAVSSATKHDEFLNEFRAKVSEHRRELEDLILTRGKQGEQQNAEITELLRPIAPDLVTTSQLGDSKRLSEFDDEETSSLAVYAEAVLGQCRRLIKLYHDAEQTTATSPNISWDNTSEMDQKDEEEVERLLHLGKQVAVRRAQRAVGACSDAQAQPHVAEEEMRQRSTKRALVCFGEDNPIDEHMHAILRNMEQGARRLLKSLPPDESAS